MNKFTSVLAGEIKSLFEKEAGLPGTLLKYVGIPAAALYGLSNIWQMTQKQHGSMWDNQFQSPPMLPNGTPAPSPAYVRQGQTVFHNPDNWGGSQGDLRSYLNNFSPDEQESLYRRGTTRYRHNFDGYDPSQTFGSPQNVAATDMANDQDIVNRGFYKNEAISNFKAKTPGFGAGFRP